MVMTSIIIKPQDTREAVLKIINDQTRFAILPDHLPGDPTGCDIHDHRSHWVFDMIEQFPACTFILSSRVAGIDHPNVCVMHFFLLDEVFHYDYDYEPDWSRRKFTASIIGGKTRINRTMASFWLANNYPKDQLTYHYTENNNISEIQQYIRSKKGINPRKFLLDTWNESHLGNCTRAMKHLLPDIINQAYINFGVESINPQLETRLTEKTLQAWLGGTLFLPLGEHQPHKEIESLGFESFSDVFDFTCSSSESHHDMTIGMLESNKDFIITHTRVEQAWHDNLPKIKHNHRLATDRGHWRTIYHDELQVLSEAVKMIDFSVFATRYQWLKFFIQ